MTESLEVPRCQCPEHDCQNTAEEYDGLDVEPAVCTPCLYGCLP